MPPIRYALDSAPPLPVTLLNAVQHVALSAVGTLIFPRLVAHAADADPELVTQYVSLAMIAMGIGTLLQAWGRWGIGSGYLLLTNCTMLYVPFAIGAAEAGGLGSVAGLTIVAGLTEIVLSRFMRVMRALLPPELIAVIIILLGVTLGMLGLELMLGFGFGESAGRLEIAASVLTLAVIVGVAMWTRSQYSSLAILAGIIAGVLTYIILELVWGDLAAVTRQVGWVQPRWPIATPAFDPVYLPGFLIGALACFVRAIADVAASQQIAYPSVRNPDWSRIRGGVVADGLGTVGAGCLGVLGISTFSASVGLAAANGVVARRVAVMAGLIWLGLGLMPGAASVLCAVPEGILGAGLFFTATYTIRKGVEMVDKRQLDARRNFVVGAAIIIGLIGPELEKAAELPTLGHQIAHSPLAIGMLAAIALNAFVRIGIARNARIRWRPAEGTRPLLDFADACGGSWAARADLVQRMRNFLEEFSGLARVILAPECEIEVAISVSDDGIRIVATWSGGPLNLAALATDENPASHALELHLMQHWVTELETESKGGEQRLTAFLDDL